MQDGNLNEIVQKRAHEIWERSGRPEGQHLEHWLQAEMEYRANAPAKRRQDAESQKSAGPKKRQRPKR